MSIAWSGIVLLLLLLPGFLFFVGIYFPEKFTRDTAQRSAIGQLAAAVLVAFLVHTCLYHFIQLACGGVIPCIDLATVLRVVTIERSGEAQFEALAANLTDHSLAITVYLGLASLCGVGLGGLVGALIVKGKLRFLAQHRWIYELSVDHDEVLTMAYVMTHVGHEGRILLYSGFLRAFSVRPDGRFSYIVLTGVSRYFLLLTGDRPVTSDRSTWQQIGTAADTPEPLRSVAGIPIGLMRRKTSYFVIEGEDIANAIFDCYPISVKIPSSDQDLTKLFSDSVKSAEARMMGEESGSRAPAASEDHTDVQTTGGDHSQAGPPS